MKKISIGLILVIVAILVLALTSAAGAKNQVSPFYLTFDLNVDWAHFSADGTYEMSDPYEDSGKVTFHWSPKGQKSATMIFVSEEGKGSFVAVIDGSEPGTADCSTVRFNVYSGFGTEDYENIGASGDATFCKEGDFMDGYLDGITRTPPGWESSE